MITSTITPSKQEIRQFTREKWREFPQLHKAMRKCPNCFEKWEKGGRVDEEKPLLYPADYDGNCLCGAELSRATISF